MVIEKVRPVWDNHEIPEKLARWIFKHGISTVNKSSVWVSEDSSNYYSTLIGMNNVAEYKLSDTEYRLLSRHLVISTERDCVLEFSHHTETSFSRTIKLIDDFKGA